MAISQLESPVFQGRYAAGATSGTPGTALVNGRIFVTTTGGTYTTAADRATVYTDKARTTEATRDSDGAIALDAAGEVELWFDGTVDIRVESSSEELQYTLVGILSSPSAVITGNYNLVLNGSFEQDDDADGNPNNWTLTPESNATISIDNSTQTNGYNSLKFAGGGSGGGIAVADTFDVTDSEDIAVMFNYKTSHVDTTNTVQIAWYDKDDNAVGSATTVYTATSAATGNSTSWQRIDRVVDVPSTAVRAAITLTGVDSGGSQLSENTWFDNVFVVPDQLYVGTAYSEKTVSYGTTGSITLDISKGTYFYTTGATTGSITFVFSNPAPTGRVSSFTLEMNDAAGNAPSWPASVDWAGGVEPTWTSGIDIVSFITRDAGTTWYGFTNGLNMS